MGCNVHLLLFYISDGLWKLMAGDFNNPRAIFIYSTICYSSAEEKRFSTGAKHDTILLL